MADAGADNTVRRELEMLEELERDLIESLQLVQLHGTVGSFSMEVAKESTLHELDQIRMRIAAARVAKDADDVHFIVANEANGDAAVDARFFGTLLVHFQMLSSSILQLIDGATTQAGPIQANIRSASRFGIKGAFSGSLGLRIAHIADDSLLQDRTETDEVLTRLVDFFDAIQRPSVISMCTSSPRIYSKYTEILKLVANSQHTVCVASRTRIAGARLRPRDARDRLLLLSEVDEQTVETWVTGKIVGTSLKKDKFELETPDGDISGDARSTAVQKIASNNLFGTRVRALLRQTIEKSALELEDPKTRYQLIDVEGIDADQNGLFTQLD